MKSNIIPLFPEAEPTPSAKPAVKGEKPDRVPQPKPADPYAHVTTSPHFERAWAAYPLIGRTRSSKKQAFPAWKKAAMEVGKDNLVAAVERYVKEDKDAKSDAGPPAFHRWLNWGRFEHWLPSPETTAQKTSRRFPDEEIRSRLVQEFGEPFVVSWLDGCDWVEGLCICKSATALAKLNESAARAVLKRLGVMVVLG